MSGVRIPPPRPLIFDPVALVEIERPKPFLVVAVAHQVEHRIVTPEVVGSRPISHPIPRIDILCRSAGHGDRGLCQGKPYSNR